MADRRQCRRLAEIEGTLAEIGGDHAGLHDLDLDAQGLQLLVQRF